MGKLCCSGVRGFDLRVDVDKSEVFRIEHTFFGEPFAAVLHRLSEFVQLHQKEIFFLDIVVSRTIIEREELQKRLVALIEAELSPRIFHHPSPSAAVGDVWAAKANFVLFSDLSYVHSLSRKVLLCDWPNASSATAVINHIRKQNVLGTRHKAPPITAVTEPFCWLQCQTTPSPAQAIVGLFKSETSLTSNANVSNKSVLGYITANVTSKSTVNFFGIDHCNSYYGRKFYLLATSITISRISEDLCDRVAAGSPCTVQPLDGKTDKEEEEEEYTVQAEQEKTFTLEASANGKRYVLEPQFTINYSLVTVREYSPDYLTRQQLWRSHGFRIVHVNTGLSLSLLGVQLAIRDDSPVAWVFDGTCLQMVDSSGTLMLKDNLFTVVQCEKKFTPIEMRFVPLEKIEALPEVIPVKQLPLKYKHAAPSEMHFVRPMFFVYAAVIAGALALSLSAFW